MQRDLDILFYLVQVNQLDSFQVFQLCYRLFDVFWLYLENSLREYNETKSNKELPSVFSIPRNKGHIAKVDFIIKVSKCVVHISSLDIKETESFSNFGKIRFSERIN